MNKNEKGGPERVIGNRSKRKYKFLLVQLRFFIFLGLLFS